MEALFVHRSGDCANREARILLRLWVSHREVFDRAKCHAPPHPLNSIELMWTYVGRDQPLR
jgi:hypothetical protein